MAARWTFAVILAIAFGASGAARAQSAEDSLEVTPAISAAESWLAGVDAGRYGESWDRASELFRQTIERTRWETTVVRARGQLGRVESRKMRSANYRRSLPGAPEGEYVVIEFQTNFENRLLTIETVTPMRDKDGAWRVSGYFIR